MVPPLTYSLTYSNPYFDLYHSVQLPVVLVINNDRLSVLAESTPLVMKELNQQKRLHVMGSVQGGILGGGHRYDICSEVDVDVHFFYLLSRINKMLLLRRRKERFSIEYSKTKTNQLYYLANPKQ